MNTKDKPRIRKTGDYEWMCENLDKHAFLFSTGFNPQHAYQNYVKNMEELVKMAHPPKPSVAPGSWVQIQEEQWKITEQPSWLSRLFG